MTQAVSAPEVPLPRLVPALLSFVAGYVDIYTFLALFGLFVAQVTGSFVTAGAEFVTHDLGIAGKMLAILAFLFAAALTAGLIGLVQHHHRAPLPWMLAFETALLAAFTVLLLIGPPITGVQDWHGIFAGLFGAMAMGTQSVIVRLLMRGIPQTNVMTGNMTQLGVETTALLLAWRRRTRHPHDRQRAGICRGAIAVAHCSDNCDRFCAWGGFRRIGMRRRDSPQAARRRNYRRSDALGSMARAAKLNVT